MLLRHLQQDDRPLAYIQTISTTGESRDHPGFALIHRDLSGQLKAYQQVVSVASCSGFGTESQRLRGTGSHQFSQSEYAGSRQCLPERSWLTLTLSTSKVIQLSKYRHPSISESRTFCRRPPD
jgi:hypothetical protein